MDTVGTEEVVFLISFLDGEVTFSTGFIFSNESGEDSHPTPNPQQRRNPRQLRRTFN